MLVAPRHCRNMADSAWWLVMAGMVLLALYLLLVKREPWRDIHSAILSGFGVTLRLVFTAMAGGLFVGSIVGLCRVSRFRPANLLASMYVELVRGMPLLVLLFMTYYGLNQYLPIKFAEGRTFGARLDSFWAAVVCFSIIYGAFIGEAVRAGIQAIPSEEIEAASLEGSPLAAATFVILPRAFRIILPAVGNEFISLLKDSAVVAIIALNDITRAGQLYSQRTFHFFETYLMLAIFYLGMTLILSRLVRLLEDAWRE